MFEVERISSLEISSFDFEKCPRDKKEHNETFLLLLFT